MYLTPTDKHWACDIEADGLLADATRIWCATVINVVTKEQKEFTDGGSFTTFLSDHSGCYLVGHNFIGYDLVMLNRHWGANFPVSRVVDTYVLSQLYNPSYKGGHSLEKWGERLKYPKGKWDDFTKFTPEMLKYCRRDVILTAYLYRKLTERMSGVGFTELGCEIEHKSWNIIQNKQRKNGFPLDRERAHKFYVSLRAREEELKAEIYKLWPAELRVVGKFKSARKKDGEYSANFIRHSQQYPKIEIDEEGNYRAYDWVEFNLGSPPQRIAKLLELGWKPVNKTKKGNPKIDEDELLAFAETSGQQEVSALAKWIVINSRANMVQTWLNAYNEDTGAIHGKLFIASTLRYRHSNPNSANIPSVRVKKDGDGNDQIQYGEAGAFTYEARDLWTCGDASEWRLVGVDGKGIQLRVLANYAYSKEFASTVLDGDPHKNNIEILGLANKAAAKKFFYTLIMGGGGARLAADQAQFGTRLTAREGEALKRKMVASIPGFHELIERLEKELEETGRIRLCDGTPILVPSPHMVIPYLLQGNESRLMKQASIYLEEEIRRDRITARKVADIHDEWQYRVHRRDVEEFIRLSLSVFPRAGERFSYKVPIEGDAKVGLTWAETH